MSLSVITLTEKPNMLYYLADELKKINPLYFAGTSKTIRKIIERKNIPNTEYIYATTFKKQWKICDTSCKKGKLLLNKNWCDLNIQLNNNTIDNKKDIDVEDKIEDDEIDIIPQEQILEAPSILTLEEHEKFRDSDGKIIEIETRGEKNEDKIYFKVKDVSLGFNLPNLNSVLLHTDKGFERNTDYVTFNRSLTNEQRDNKKPSLYLTYNGFLRVLFVSRNQNAKQFRKWAEKILFTCQFGSKENKEELASELLNVNVRSIRDVFKSSVNSFPCIYLFELGKVSQLRDTFNISNDIDDNMTIYKYGMTDNMKERILKHISDYGKMKNVNMKLKLFSYIDVKYKLNAEQDLRLFFNSINIKLQLDGTGEAGNRNELIVINEKMYKMVEKHFKTVSNEYLGATREIQEKMEKMKNEHENELLKKDMEILKLQHEKENYKNIYEYKDEIYKLQIENLKLQLELTRK
jgi:hypothetical protein